MTVQGEVWVVQVMDEDGETTGHVCDDIFEVAGLVPDYRDAVQIRCERATTDGLAHRVCIEVDRMAAEALQ